VHGAFEPATGEATLVVSGKRDSASHIQLLEKVIHTFPAERLVDCKPSNLTKPAKW
jgi:hypothetical protein